MSSRQATGSKYMEQHPYRRARIRWRLAVCALLPVLPLFLGSCGDSSERDYFPLAPGWSWNYGVISDIRNVGKFHGHNLVANGTTVTVDGEKTTPRMYQDGHVFYYASRDEGILLVAERPAWQDAKPVQPDQWVIKYPLAIGTSWPVWSETRLLRRQVFSPTAVVSVPVVAPIEINYTVEAVNDTVKVRAGTFHDCLRIKGHGEAVVDMGVRVGEVEIIIDTTQWFAPGVGLVKVIRQEDSRPESPAAGVMTVELESIDTGSWFN